MDGETFLTGLIEFTVKEIEIFQIMPSKILEIGWWLCNAEI
jgi:hypothetical protein